MIYRSPKWLRNILDFEINTSKDIKGVPSLRRQKKIDKRKELERLKRINIEWNRRWDSKDDYTFKDFYKEKYNYSGGFGGGKYINMSDLRIIKSKN